MTYLVFDVLAVEGFSMTSASYERRRALLEALELERPGVQLVASVDDGEALWLAVLARGLEGVVAKLSTSRYRPAERLWVKTKNRATARFQEERAGAVRRATR